MAGQGASWSCGATPSTSTLALYVVTRVFVLPGLFTDGGCALSAGAMGPWPRRSARFLRGERYAAGCTFIGLGAAAALTPGHQNR
ncbi:hypothetical protein GCM10009780_63220 [Actinomadura alba]